jgi:ABC-type multidrug transport system fused ATPase/permease subunit
MMMMMMIVVAMTMMIVMMIILILMKIIMINMINHSGGEDDNNDYNHDDDQSFQASFMFYTIVLVCRYLITSLKYTEQHTIHKVTLEASKHSKYNRVFLVFHYKCSCQLKLRTW